MTPRFDSIPSGPKTVLLVGSGAVGSVVARHLSASSDVGEIVVSDVDGDRAKRAATRVGSTKARALRLDASDGKALRRAMRGCDLVVNASLPRFNSAIQAAALDVGLHYLDPANEAANPFDDSDQWKERGLTALLGMGEDPGLSNVFARYAADGMDRVDSIKVRDGDTASSPDYPFIALFSPETFVEETLASSKIFRDGAYEVVPPFGAAETYEFPAPLGPLTVYSVEHEEVDTLPKFIGKGVRYVDFKLALDERTVRTLTLLRDLRLLDVEADPALRKAVFRAIPQPADLAGRVDGYAAVLVEVSGERAGQRVVHQVYAIMGHREASDKFGATATAYLTGTGAAAGALLIADGTIRERGKLSPESLDPTPFFPLLRRFGVEVRERITRERALSNG